MNNRLVSVSAAGGDPLYGGFAPLYCLASIRAVSLFLTCQETLFRQGSVELLGFLVFCIVDHRFGGLVGFAFLGEGDF